MKFPIEGNLCALTRNFNAVIRGGENRISDVPRCVQDRRGKFFGALRDILGFLGV